MTRVLGINASHNGSVAVVEDGKVVFFLEEERLTRNKRQEGVKTVLSHVLEKDEFDSFDAVLFNSTVSYNSLLEDAIKVIEKHDKTKNAEKQYVPHHDAHSMGSLYTSNFGKDEDILSIVLDGSGEMVQIPVNEKDSCGDGGCSDGSCSTDKDKPTQTIDAFETESVYTLKNKVYSPVYKKFGMNQKDNQSVAIFRQAMAQMLPQNCEVKADDFAGITKTYESTCTYVGLPDYEAGKLMGMAAHGTPLDFKLLTKGHGDSNLFACLYPGLAQYRIDSLEIEPYRGGEKKQWYFDLAATIQRDTQEALGDLVEKYVNETGIKNVTISGGYGLNTVCNSYLVERFPDVNFYNNPLSSDAGISVGCALSYFHHTETQTFNPYTDLGLGNEYKVSEDDIKEFEDFLNFEEIGEEECVKQGAEEVSEGLTIAWHFGKSEAGPRALGHRSIISDPRDEDGQDFVNELKGREWYRPLAGSMLKEKYSEWFEGDFNCEHMMYVTKSKQPDEIPAMLHEDETCRIQTVESGLYYNLIKEFYKLTEIPMVLNTSFNSAGEALCETIFDSLRAFMDMDDISTLYIEGYKVTRK